MITNYDRSGWFGASDTRMVTAKNRTTKSWIDWWEVKLGLKEATELHTKAIDAGNAWEHKILNAVDPDMRKDHQIIIEKYRLRVNYDGDKDGTIYEVKTHNFMKEFKVVSPYWKQAQVEMYAMKTQKLYIVAYGLIQEEYENYSLPIDDKRITFHPVEYDRQWIQNEYLPKLKECCRALRKGRFLT